MRHHPHCKIRRRIRIAALFILGGILMAGTFGCGKAEYAVNYCGQQDLYRDARDTYKAGEQVTLTYCGVGPDTECSFRLDGEPLDARYDEKQGGFILRFTMPDRDVRLECSAVSPGTADSGDGVAGDLLLDFYTGTTAAADGGSYTEMVLYAHTADEVWLVVYGREDGAEETAATYIVPYAAFSRCCDVIDEENMRAWNEADPQDSEEGALTVVKFREPDGSYVRVTSDAMPSGGSQAFSRIRQTLASYIPNDSRE